MNLPEKMAVLQALFDAELNGRVGTPKERLAAIARKADCDCRSDRFRRLTIQQQGAVFYRVCAGAPMDEALKTVENP